MIMGLTLKPQHLKRYRDIAWLLWKYGRSDLVRQAGLEHTLTETDRLEDSRRRERGEAALGEELADDLEKLGPTFIKLGQLLSTRADLLPQAYLDGLQRLQDHIEPFDAAVAQQIISEELGVRFSRAFSEFDCTPLAAASLGQVHRAKLRDGRPVAVKIQRPGIRTVISQDLDALDEIARFLDLHTEVGRQYEFYRILAQLRRSLLAELDYLQEARNLHVLRENLRTFRRIVIPKPYDDYTSPRVLTMELIRGHKLTSLSPVALVEMDRKALADELARAYHKQILVDGFFHADPHPGNVHITEDCKLVLLDLGMVGRLPPKLQESLVKLLLAISEGRGEDAARIGLEIGEKREHHDEAAFIHRAAELVAQHRDARLQDIQTGRVVLEIQRIAAETRLRLPQEFTMIGKALMNLDMIARTLDPDFDPNASIRRNATNLLQHRMRNNFSVGNLYNSLLEMTEFAQRLPDRLNRLSEVLASNSLKLHVDAIDEDRLIRGMQKIANRITMGLILAALIIGAALLMRIQTRFEVFGYPGLAILLFMAAALGGIALMINILRNDE